MQHLRLSLLAIVTMAGLMAGCIEHPGIAPSQTESTGTAVAHRGPLAIPSAQVGSSEERTPGMQRYESAWVAGTPEVPFCSFGPGAPWDPCCGGDISQTLKGLGDGVHFERFRVMPETRGQPFTLNLRAHGVDGIGYIAFFDATENHVGGSTVTLWIGSGSGTANGTVPAAGDQAVLWTCLSGPVRANYEAAARAGSFSHHFVSPWLVGRGEACSLADTWNLIEDGSPRMVRDAFTDRFPIPPTTRGAAFRFSVHFLIDNADPRGLSGVITFFDEAGDYVDSTWAHGPMIGNMAVAEGFVPHEASYAVLSSCGTGPFRAVYHAGP